MATNLSITDTGIKNLKPKDRTYSQHFGGGFYVYVHPNGRKVCRYCYQVKNSTGERFMTGKRKGKLKPHIMRRYELGEYSPSRGRLAELKAKYDLVHTDRIHNKTDPVAEAEKEKLKQADKFAKIEKKRKRAERKELNKAGTMSFFDVAQAFLKKYQGLKGDKVPSPRTMQDYRYHLEAYLLPEFGQFPMMDLPVDKVMDALDDLALEKPTMANRVFSTVSVVCTWAKKQKRYQLSQNPFAGRDKPGGREEPKSRVLDFNVKHKRFKNKGEIKKLWNWLESVNPVHAMAFKLILLTGQRPGEALSAEWEDFYEDEWVLPAEKTKNKKDIHQVPVVPALRELLDELKLLTGNTPYLFPALVGAKPNGDPVKPATLSRHISKALLGEHIDYRGKKRQAGKLHGLEKFTTHDLRRTCSTHIGDLGFSDADVGLLLNHSRAGVTANVYNQANPIEKKVTMLESWHRRLDELIKGKNSSNVVGIRA